MDEFTRMRIRELETSLDALRHILSSVQGLQRETMDALLKIGRVYCNEELERYSKTVGGDLYSHPREVIQILLAHLDRIRFPMNVIQMRDHMETLGRDLDEAQATIKRLKADLERKQGSVSLASETIRDQEKRIEKLSKQVNQLTKERDAVLAENERLEAERDRLKDEVSRLQGMLAVFQQMQATGATTILAGSNAAEVSGVGEMRMVESPDPTQWSRNRQAVLQAIGDGVFLAQDIQARTDLSKTTAYRILKELADDGLIVESERLPISGGRGEVAYTLTDQGVQAYQELMKRAPSRLFERLMQAHKSAKHLAGILRVGRFFQALGYEVILEPQRIPLEDKRAFLPDLVVRMGEETCYLEVEVEKKRGGTNSDWPQKWENATQASGGRIWVAAESSSLLKRIKSSVTHWAGTKGKNVTLYGLDMTKMDVEQANQTGQIWHLKKQLQFGKNGKKGWE